MPVRPAAAGSGRRGRQRRRGLPPRGSGWAARHKADDVPQAAPRSSFAESLAAQADETRREARPDPAGTARRRGHADGHGAGRLGLPPAAPASRGLRCRHPRRRPRNRATRSRTGPRSDLAPAGHQLGPIVDQQGPLPDLGATPPGGEGAVSPTTTGRRASARSPSSSASLGPRPHRRSRPTTRGRAAKGRPRTSSSPWTSRPARGRPRAGRLGPSRARRPPSRSGRRAARRPPAAGTSRSTARTARRPGAATSRSGGRTVSHRASRRRTGRPDRSRRPGTGSRARRRRGGLPPGRHPVPPGPPGGPEAGRRLRRAGDQRAASSTRCGPARRSTSSRSSPASSSTPLTRTRTTRPSMRTGSLCTAPATATATEPSPSPGTRWVRTARAARPRCGSARSRPARDPAAPTGPAGTAARRCTSPPTAAPPRAAPAPPAR